MNSLFSRTLLIAALLSIFNTAVAGDGLLDIEVSPNHLVEEEQPATEMDNAREIESGNILEIETQTSSQPQMERELISINLPTRGMNKDMVNSEFGSPLHIRPAVGKPPISSWVYDEYTVYFEHQWVLHSVLNRKK